MIAFWALNCIAVVTFCYTTNIDVWWCLLSAVAKQSGVSFIKVKFVVQLLCPWRCRHYSSGSQILSASAAGRQHFVQQRPIFVGTQYGTCFMSHFGRLEFWGGFWIFGKRGSARNVPKRRGPLAQQEGLSFHCRVHKMSPPRHCLELSCRGEPSWCWDWNLFRRCIRVFRTVPFGSCVFVICLGRPFFKTLVINGV